MLTEVEFEGKRYEVKEYLMSEIFHDIDFNMRGRIAPIDVIDLANDIKERGLDQPIVLQPYHDPEKPQFKYRIVAGHRRHRAFQVNDSDRIPAFLRTDLTEISARMLNLRENVQRAATNIMQEAKHVKYFLEHNLTENTIGDMTGQSRGWVQVRVALLRLPADIQEVAAAGIMTQEQIRHASRIKDKQKLYDFVLKIKMAKERGETVKPAMTIARIQDAMKAKARNKTEMSELRDIIYDVLGPCLATRVLAWACGDVSTAPVHVDIQKEAKAQGKKYDIPDYVNKAISGVRE